MLKVIKANGRFSERPAKKSFILCYLGLLAQHPGICLPMAENQRIQRFDYNYR